MAANNQQDGSMDKEISASNKNIAHKEDSSIGEDVIMEDHDSKNNPEQSKENRNETTSNLDGSSSNHEVDDASERNVEVEEKTQLADLVDQQNADEDESRPKKRLKNDFEEFTKLEEFGYHFKDGRLCNIKDGKGFEFNKYSDLKLNQLHYERLGEVITQHVYQLLEEEGKLKRMPVPTNSEPKSFIYVSENYDKVEKLMILIHGNGVVRAGQWARRLIINDCLDSGTMLPYIHRAHKEGYGVLITNTNHNHVKDGNKDIPIPGSSDPMEHALTVWDNIVSQCAAKYIAVVAHSFGGVVTVNLGEAKEEFRERVFAVAFTDSVHSLEMQEVSNSTVKYFKQNSQNWICSNKPLDEAIILSKVPAGMPKKQECPNVSAGTLKHEETSFYAFASIFKYFQVKYDDCQQQ